MKKALIISLLCIALLNAPSLPHVQAEQPASVEDWFLQDTESTDEEANDVNENEDTNTNTDEELETDILPTNTSVGIWDFVKMLFATAFVVGLIYFTFRFINKRNRVFSGVKYMENMGGTSLGTNRSVQLIKVGNRILIVGVGETITLLKEISDEDEVSSILDEHNRSLEQLMQPGDIFNRLLNKKQEQTREKQNFQSELQKQLKDLTEGRKQLIKELEKGRDQHE